MLPVGGPTASSPLNALLLVSVTASHTSSRTAGPSPLHSIFISHMCGMDGRKSYIRLRLHTVLNFVPWGLEACWWSERQFCLFAMFQILHVSGLPCWKEKQEPLWETVSCNINSDNMENTHVNLATYCACIEGKAAAAVRYPR